MRLNIGAGNWQPDDYITVDLAHADVCHNLADMPWPFADGSASEILASHVLEHFPRHTAVQFLRECYRILMRGGTLHLAVPDMDRFIDCHLSGDFTPLGGYHWRSLDTLMGGGGAEPRAEQRHQYMWCEWSLSYVLETIGFRVMRRYGAMPIHNPAYHAISLYLEAMK